MDGSPITAYSQCMQVIEEIERLAFCSVCRGILPFDEVRPPSGILSSGSSLYECRRCRTTFRLVDPRRAALAAGLRYLVYGAGSGLVLALYGAGLAALGPEHPLAGGWHAVSALVAGIVTFGCLARSLALFAASRRYERLESYEAADLARRLCLGMIRSDVVRELGLKGWRPGKIRSVLGALRPASPRGA